MAVRSLVITRVSSDERERLDSIEAMSTMIQKESWPRRSEEALERVQDSREARGKEPLPESGSAGPDPLAGAGESRGRSQQDGSAQFLASVIDDRGSSKGFGDVMNERWMELELRGGSVCCFL
jgi:hypothetical protein